MKKGIFIVLSLFFFGLLMGFYINTDKKLSCISNKIIRLHVVANSDSPEDQKLKLQVRDNILSTIGKKLEGLKDIAEAKSIIEKSLEEIESFARETAIDCGKPYDVKASFGIIDFPAKAYGNITLPAGTYQALNIVIGEGKGKNWWCVMFPPLCFIDVAHGVVSEKTMKEFKTSLTDEEYKLLLSAGTKGRIPVKLRFKILELAESMNLKFVWIGKK